MSVFVIDTSVALAWYLEEEFSSAARQRQDRLLSGAVRLPVPSLHYWEFANALRTLAARKAIEEGTAQEVLDLHLVAPLEVAEPDRREVFRLALANDVHL
jgi:predicted nucleic acid-binding protein